MEKRNERNLNHIKERVLMDFQKSGKRHLLITGSKGIGKSTLLRQIIKSESSYGGIITRLICDSNGHSKHVLLLDALDSRRVTKVGVINSIGTAMDPIIQGFEGLGREILCSYRRSNKDLIIIDEIGYMESKAIKYREEIHLCFDEKRVIAVLRKSSTPFLEEIRRIEDSFLVDLDDYYQ